MPENIRSELSHTSYNKASWGKDNMGAWCTGTKPSPVFEAAAGCFEPQLMWVKTWVVVHHNMVKSTGCPSLPNGTGKVGGICYHAPSRSPHQHPYMVQLNAKHCRYISGVVPIPVPHYNEDKYKFPRFARSHGVPCCPFQKQGWNPENGKHMVLPSHARHV